MPILPSRYASPLLASVAEGWTLERLTPPSRLHGANGLATGPDGRLYVAQVPGSQVSAIDVDSGVIETISAMGGAMSHPTILPSMKRVICISSKLPRVACVCGRQRAM